VYIKSCWYFRPSFVICTLPSPQLPLSPSFWFNTPNLPCVNKYRYMYFVFRARICKRLWNPGIDFEESIPPGWQSWGSLKGLQIRDQCATGGRGGGKWGCVGEYSRYWSRIFKWSPGIDSKERIPPAYVAWRAGTITLFLLGSWPP
jgi:hypothetical protein